MYVELQGREDPTTDIPHNSYTFTNTYPRTPPPFLFATAIMEASQQQDQEEAKRISAGKSAYSFLVLLTSAALCCGLYANSYCSFAERKVTFVPGFNITEACSTFDLGDQYQPWCETLLSDHGVGFYGWYGTIPVDTQVCFPYTWYNPFIFQYIQPELDTKFNTARVMAVLANVNAAMALFTFWFSGCCPLTQERFKGMASYFFLSCLFQGLTFLLFSSNVCESEFLQEYFPNTDFGEVVAKVECKQSSGSRCAIAATVLYFFCMQLVPIAIVPRPLGREPTAGEETQPSNIEAEA